MATPQRIQLRRTRGWNLQRESVKLNGLPAVKCARPGPWGNPHKIGQMAYVPGRGRVMVETREQAVEYFRLNITYMSIACYLSRASIRQALNGKNLACFCKLTDPCHCDVLLEIANPSRCK